MRHRLALGWAFWVLFDVAVGLGVARGWGFSFGLVVLFCESFCCAM